MGTRYFALVAGVIYIIVAIWGFIPGLLAPPAADAPPLAVGALHGRVMGLFPVNVLHSLIHLAIGIWGVVAWRSLSASVTYAQGLAIIYGVLGLMGLIPGLRTVFGLAPLYGHDVWLHWVTAAVAAYFGWFAQRAAGTARAPHPRS